MKNKVSEIKKDRYRRTEKLNPETEPRKPVLITSLEASVPFVLVREATDCDWVSGKVGWFIWREDQLVGYVPALYSKQWHDHVFDGTYPPLRKCGDFFQPRHVSVSWSPRLDPESRGLGIMTVTYVEIIRQLSSNGFAFASTVRNRNEKSRPVWRRLKAIKHIQIARRQFSRGSDAPFYIDYAFMLIDT